MARTLLDPFGDDEWDIDLNYLIDHNLSTSLAIVQEDYEEMNWSELMGEKVYLDGSKGAEKDFSFRKSRLMQLLSEDLGEKSTLPLKNVAM